MQHARQNGAVRSDTTAQLQRDTQASLDGLTAALARADVALARMNACEQRLRELRAAERVADILAARYHLPPVRAMRPR